MVLKFLPVEDGTATPARVFFADTQGAKDAWKHIYIKCPGTGEPVSTGLNTKSVVFESLPSTLVPLRCPACGKTHKWRPDDAWVGM
jgi:hypothetical protein